MFPITNNEVCLWTIVGLCRTAWEVFITNNEDIVRMWANMSNIRESKNFAFFCNFCIVRLYLLTYVVMVYPVFVERQKMLITPWLVVSGLRCLAQHFFFRIYFWIVVFRFWMSLIDRDILENQRDVSSEERRKYLQKLDIDEENLIKETRRRIKGIRSYHIFTRKQDLTKIGLVKKTNVCLETYEEIVNEIFQGDIEEDDSDDSLTEESEQERNSMDFNENKCYYYVKRFTPLDTTSPILVTDCILLQITELMQILVSNPTDELLKECAEAEISLKLNRDNLMSCCRTTLPTIDTPWKTPKYSTPKYLSDYPEIFGNKVKEKSRRGKFGRMLMNNDTLRETFEEFYQ